MMTLDIGTRQSAFSIHVRHRQARLNHAPFHRWAHVEERPWLEFYRAERGYLLRFPDLADFHIFAGGWQIECERLPQVTEETAWQLYRNQVYPLVMSLRGVPVYHASAVSTGNGAIAFLGASGLGKSTLATAFATTGHPFLADDGLILELRNQEYWVMPSHSSIRLWEDSRQSLLSGNAELAPPVCYSPKARFLAGAKFAHCPEPRRLEKLYVLSSAPVEEITLNPLRAAQRVAKLLQNSFLLDPEDKVLLTRQLDQVSDLAQSVSAFDLAYPRRYSDLPKVTASILAHAQVNK